MKKLIAIIITALILCSTLSLACSAYSSDVKGGAEITTSTAEDTSAGTSDVNENDANLSQGSTSMPEGEDTTDKEASDINDATGEGATDKDSEQITDDTQEAKNPFEAVFEKVKEHSDTIFSFLTLIGSVILALTYKKGLLPVLGASIGKIGDSVKKIGDATELSIINSEGAIIDIDEKIKGMGELFDRLENQITDLDKKLDAVAEESAQSEKTRILMRSQVDMLYDIFMTSSLPQYSKDAVGEKIAVMKSILAEGEK